jgi:hypothetical protein
MIKVVCLYNQLNNEPLSRGNALFSFLHPFSFSAKMNTLMQEDVRLSGYANILPIHTNTLTHTRLNTLTKQLVATAALQSDRLQPGQRRQ